MKQIKYRANNSNYKKGLWLVLVGLMVFGIQSFAQTNDLKINDVFKTYGKQKGAIMVEMQKEMLSGYDFNYYRSMTIENNEAAIDFTRNCLLSDQKGAKKVKEVYADGKPVTIYLQLPPRGYQHRLILFNESRKNGKLKMTLIYMESEKENILNLVLHKK